MPSASNLFLIYSVSSTLTVQATEGPAHQIRRLKIRRLISTLDAFNSMTGHPTSSDCGWFAANSTAIDRALSTSAS